MQFIFGDKQYSIHILFVVCFIFNLFLEQYVFVLV